MGHCNKRPSGRAHRVTRRSADGVHAAHGDWTLKMSVYVLVPRRDRHISRTAPNWVGRGKVAQPDHPTQIASRKQRAGRVPGLSHIDTLPGETQVKIKLRTAPVFSTQYGKGLGMGARRKALPQRAEQ